MSTPTTSMPPSGAPSQDEDDSIETPTIRFTSAKVLLDCIDDFPSDYLTVTHVSPPSFTRIERERDRRHRKYRFRRYDCAAHVLTMTLNTDLHETLHGELYYAFRDLRFMPHDRGLREEWAGGDVMEGNSTGGPQSVFERRGDGRWPTLVVLGGDTEPLTEMRRDMAFWFSRSGHRVKVVVLAKFERRRRVVVVERWEEEDGRIEIVGGGLVLGFRSLFLRDPGPEEGDFVVSMPDLEEYAERVFGQSA
ncbi:hypothetical protein C8A01DRAFT_49067 [Parachaetomium inaequale]|uniref:Uncharacterized protein n=1 Tax=Parachaetomium inaequale TaxID=2588326 RepID=A0AAN6PA79_9PEZI|nr:hypothetical protein C8A01DRAFT_49067 [Parachaetomium inaequale]